MEKQSIIVYIINLAPDHRSRSLSYYKQNWLVDKQITVCTSVPELIKNLKKYHSPDEEIDLEYLQNTGKHICKTKNIDIHYFLTVHKFEIPLSELDKDWKFYICITEDWDEMPSRAYGDDPPIKCTDSIQIFNNYAQFLENAHNNIVEKNPYFSTRNTLEDYLAGRPYCVSHDFDFWIHRWQTYQLDKFNYIPSWYIINTLYGHPKELLTFLGI